jgi:hypothetical protein
MNTVSDKIEEEVLIRLLLERQPHSMGVLDLLQRRFTNKGGRGAFAPIKGGNSAKDALSLHPAQAPSLDTRAKRQIKQHDTKVFILFPKKGLTHLSI